MYQGPQLCSYELVPLCEISITAIQRPGIEVQNALGTWEHYHSYLRKVFKCILDEEPNMSRHHKLRLAFKSANETTGTVELVPTLLVFGVQPRMSVIIRQFPNYWKQFNEIKLARQKMEFVSASYVKRALTTPVPATVNREITIGDRALIFREKNTNEWTGPHLVVDVKAGNFIPVVNERGVQYYVHKKHNFSKLKVLILIFGFPSSFCVFKAFV